MDFAFRTTFLFVALCLPFNHSGGQESADSGIGRVYFSADQGESWKKSDKGFPPDAAINDFAYANGTLFAVTDAHGVFISEDRLKNWQASNKGLPSNIKINAAEIYRNCIIIGTHGHGIFVSDNNGESWYASNKGLKNRNVRCLYTTASKVFSGTDDGVFVSTNGGRSWIQSFSDKQINGFASVNNKIYAATNRGIIISADQGAHWDITLSDASVHNVSNNEESVFAMTYGPAVLRAKDDSGFWRKEVNWVKSDTGLPNLYTFQIKSTGSRLIACQWDGIYKSDDNGSSWEKIGRGLPAGAYKELLITDFGVIAGAGK